MTRISNLILSDNIIIKISKNSFNGLTNLRALLLDGNQIDIVSPNTFQEMPYFTKLSLYKNKLTSISKSEIGLVNEYVEVYGVEALP